MPTQGRNNAIDLIKILMAILVISIHTITPNGTFDYLLTQSAARIAVPFFFIAAGYYFPSNPKGSDICKTIFRITSLYFAWCLFYLPFEISDIALKANSFGGIIGESAYTFIKGWRHLWFMPALIIGMVLYYFLRNNKYINLIALALYALGFLLQSSMPHGEYSILFYRNFLTFAFPLIAMGSAIKTIRIEGTSGLAYLSGLIMITAILLLEGYVRMQLNIYNNDLLILSPLVAACIFMLALRSNAHVPFGVRGIASSMYFIHYFFYLVLKSHISNEAILFVSVCVLSILFSFALNNIRLYRTFFT